MNNNMDPRERAYMDSLLFSQKFDSLTNTCFNDHYTNLYSSCSNYLNINDIDGLNEYLDSLTTYDLFYLKTFLKQNKSLKFYKEISSIIIKKLSNKNKRIILKKPEK